VNEPTGFLGLSHLGIVSSIGWASFGEPVVAVDLDRAPIERLQRGELPLHEPGLDTLFARSRPSMTFTTDPRALGRCPLVIVSRDVPTDVANASDPAVVLELMDAVLPHLRQDVTLALTSQVPPGFTRRLAERLRTRRPELRFELYYWVETLIFGNAVERYLRPERLMLGCAEPAAPLSPFLEAGLRRFGCPILPMRYESAELAKTAINLYLCAAVTYANTLADLCETVGADWTEMLPALRLDKRIGPAAYIRPGLGIAGGNLERDLVTLRDLCRANEVDGALIETMVDYNARRHWWVHRKLEEHLFPSTPSPTIAVWGLAYKKNTRSTKNSMALRVIGELAGRADVRAWDPMVGASDVSVPAKVVAHRDEALVAADCLLILADWDEFAVPRPEALRTMRRPLIIDCVGVVDAERADLGGVQYFAMGRPA
jgi:UDPglucose 6-dehydrogenase